jgi:hypothetical protein
MIDVLDCSIVPEVAPKKRGGGPKTPEGKERAKANSMKHGLRAKVLVIHGPSHPIFIRAAIIRQGSGSFGGRARAAIRKFFVSQKLRDSRRSLGTVFGPNTMMNEGGSPPPRSLTIRLRFEGIEPPEARAVAPGSRRLDPSHPTKPADENAPNDRTLPRVVFAVNLFS